MVLKWILSLCFNSTGGKVFCLIITDLHCSPIELLPRFFILFLDTGLENIVYSSTIQKSIYMQPDLFLLSLIDLPFYLDLWLLIFLTWCTFDDWRLPTVFCRARQQVPTTYTAKDSLPFRSPVKSYAHGLEEHALLSWFFVAIEISSFYSTEIVLKLGNLKSHFFNRTWVWIMLFFVAENWRKNKSCRPSWTDLQLLPYWLAVYDLVELIHCKTFYFLFLGCVSRSCDDKAWKLINYPKL